MYENKETETQSINTLSSQTSDEALPQASQKKRLPRYPVFGELVLVGAVLVSVFAFPYLTMQLRKSGLPAVDAVRNAVVTTPAAAAPEIVVDTGAFSELALLGHSVMVYDVARGKALFTKNENEKLPLASVAKLMTALVAHEILPADERLTIPAQYELAEYSALVPGDTLLAQDLLDYTLIVSSNEGANIIAEASAKEALGANGTVKDFVHAMNIRAELLGLSSTEYHNPSGLDISDTLSGAYGSARDMATLLALIIQEYPDILSATVLPEKKIQGSGGFIYTAKNTNGVTSEIPGLIASKTGYETLAGGNLAVAFNAGLNRPIIVVVLGSTKSGRFDDILKLVEAARIAVAK